MTREFWKAVFSEGGTPSSKRVACGYIITAMIKDGCTECVKDLLQTIIISGMSLLGLSSVTDIFKKGKTEE